MAFANLDHKQRKRREVGVLVEPTYPPHEMVRQVMNASIKSDRTRRATTVTLSPMKPIVNRHANQADVRWRHLSRYTMTRPSIVDTSTGNQ